MPPGAVADDGHFQPQAGAAPTEDLSEMSGEMNSMEGPVGAIFLKSERRGDVDWIPLRGGDEGHGKLRGAPR